MLMPKICAVIVDNDLPSIMEIEKFVDLFEVRIDIIGNDWQELVKKLKKPWIACNRIKTEGGKWQDSEEKRIDSLIMASNLGAAIVDIELSAKDLTWLVPLIKRRSKCLISYHDLELTPSFDELKKIARRQIEAGADIVKIASTAKQIEDNILVLSLISEFQKKEFVSFAMGQLGLISRVLCPLVGGSFTYAAINKGKESAEGQITVKELYEIYRLISYEQ